MAVSAKAARRTATRQLSRPCSVSLVDAYSTPVLKSCTALGRGIVYTTRGGFHASPDFGIHMRLLTERPYTCIARVYVRSVFRPDGDASSHTFASRRSESGQTKDEADSHGSAAAHPRNRWRRRSFAYRLVLRCTTWPLIKSAVRNKQPALFAAGRARKRQ